MEIWKDIEGFNGRYQISNLGRVKSLNYNNTKQEKILVNSLSNRGYYRVSLSLEGQVKQYNVHRLVAEAFIPNPNQLPFINHIDENRTNNNVDNLEWCSVQYNNTYGTALDKRRISQNKPVRCIETQQVFESAKQAGLLLDINPSSISKCCRGQRKTCNNLHWEFV